MTDFFVIVILLENSSISFDIYLGVGWWILRVVPFLIHVEIATVFIMNESIYYIHTLVYLCGEPQQLRCKYWSPGGRTMAYFIVFVLVSDAHITMIDAINASWSLLFRSQSFRNCFSRLQYTFYFKNQEKEVGEDFYNPASVSSLKMSLLPKMNLLWFPFWIICISSSAQNVA